MGKFGLSNESLVMSILRSDLYSDPIKVIVQEYICNARDSHRDSNILSKPIEVHLPTKVEPWFSVRDFGNGITPENFDSIFTQYCESTKRGNEKSTGGFGIGAKSAWATFKNFYVTSWTGGVKRKYSCYLKCVDEHNSVEDGFSELVEEEKDDQQGILIHIDVTKENYSQAIFNESDIREQFSNNYEFITLFWNLKPVCNLEIPYEAEMIISGDGWRLYSYNSIFSKSYVIIDGVPYPIDSKIFDKNKTILERNLVLFFENKSLAISPSRESLRYTDDTKDKIISKLEEIKNYCSSELDEALSKCSNIYEANLLYDRELRDIGFDKILGYKRWNSVDIFKELYIDYMFRATLRIVRVFRNNFESNKLTFDETTFIEGTSPIIINTTEQKESKARLKTFFETNPDVKNATVLTFESTNGYNKFDKEYKISKWNCIDTKDIPKNIKRTKNTTTKTKSVKVEQFTLSTQCCEQIVVDSSSLKDTYFIELRRNKMVFGDTEMYFNNQVMCDILTIAKIEKVVYIPSRFVKQFIKKHKVKPFLPKFKEELSNELSLKGRYFDYYKSNFWNEMIGTYRYHSLTTIKNELLKSCLPTNHPIVRQFQIEKEIETINSDDFIGFVNELKIKHSLTPTVNNVEKEKARDFVQNYIKIKKENEANYKLLFSVILDSYKAYDFKSEIVEYINFIDNKQNKV